MPPRTRRTAAAAAAAAMAADFQAESDAEMADDRDLNEGDDEEEVASGEEEPQSVSHGTFLPYQGSSSFQEDEEGPPTKPTTQPTLKITLKLPPSHAFASNNSPGTATPEELDYIAFKRTPRRRAKS